MSTREKRASKGKFIGYFVAGLIHVAIIAALFININSEPDNLEITEAAFAEKIDVVRATTVDESHIKEHIDSLKQQEREKEQAQQLEEARLKKLQEDAKIEEQRIEDLKEEQKEQEAELEKQRQENEALALKRKEEEEKREQEIAAEEERKKKLAEEERQKKLAEEAERKKKLEEERQQALAEQERQEQEDIFQQMLQQEEQFAADNVRKERSTTVAQKYLSLIGNAVKKVRTLDASFHNSLFSVVNIKVDSSGRVQAVRTIQSSGNARYDRSVETAVYKASPLPLPDIAAEPEAHRRLLNFNLRVRVSDI